MYHHKAPPHHRRHPAIRGRKRKHSCPEQWCRPHVHCCNSVSMESRARNPRRPSHGCSHSRSCSAPKCPATGHFRNIQSRRESHSHTHRRSIHSHSRSHSCSAPKCLWRYHGQSMRWCMESHFGNQRHSTRSRSRMHSRCHHQRLFLWDDHGPSTNVNSESPPSNLQLGSHARTRTCSRLWG